MAQVLNNTVLRTVFHAVETAVVATFGAIGSFMVSIMQANSRQEQFEHMNNLTDLELANKYGINRDQIVAYVFRDKWV